MSSAFEYRPAVDGLRALAVLSVFVFHLDHAWLEGGFVGVDVFFVISGYLISSIILAECDADRFSLKRFYQRRVARIFPVFFLVAAASMLAASLVYSSQDFASAGANLVAATLSLANVKYMLQGDYFTISQDAQPFLHYWSLSVEEQFYVVYPLALFLVRKLVRNRKVQFGLLVGALLASLALCIVVTMQRPTWAFYLLPTRGWELLAGGLVALWSANGWPVWKPRPRAVLAVAGIAMVATSFVLIHGGAGFPGIVAAVPVLGTCLIIAADPAHRGVSERLLSLAPVVAIGKLSYSIYLWHWPIFSFTDYALYDQPMLPRLAIKIVLTAACSIAGFALVEGPARRALNAKGRAPLAFASFAALAALFIVSGSFVRRHYFLNADPTTVAKGGIAVRPAAVQPDAHRVLLVGDSNASMYGAIMRDLAARLSGPVNIVSVAAGQPIPRHPGEEPDPLWVDSLEAARALRPTRIIYVIAWTERLSDDHDRLVAAVEALSELTDRVVLITQPPRLPEGASRDEIRAGARPPFYEDPAHRAKRTAINQFLLSLESQRVRVVDIEPIFTAEDLTINYAREDGRFLFQDAGHLSGEGAQLVLDRLVEAILAE